jgi:hypothetical protein
VSQSGCAPTSGGGGTGGGTSSTYENTVIVTANNFTADGWANCTVRVRVYNTATQVPARNIAVKIDVPHYTRLSSQQAYTDNNGVCTFYWGTVPNGMHTIRCSSLFGFWDTTGIGSATVTASAIGGHSFSFNSPTGGTYYCKSGNVTGFNCMWSFMTGINTPAGLHVNGMGGNSFTVN